MKIIKKMSDHDRRPKNKTAAFTMDERKLLMKLVNLHYDVLNTKVINHITVKQKRQAWVDIHKAFLENAKLIKLPRTLNQLKRCWDNIKCKAKKGDPTATKLMQLGEDQHIEPDENTCMSENQVNSSTISLDPTSEDPDVEQQLGYEQKDKQEEIQKFSKKSLDESFLKIKEALDNSECTHCTCEKFEKNAKVQLMVLQKHLNEELHELEMHLMKERLKNERQLHKLHVHEMTLKIQNERRRAEILEKELGN